MEKSFLVLAKRRPGLEACVRFLRDRSTQVEVIVGDRGDPPPVPALSGWEGDILISYLSPWIVPASALERARIATVNFHPGPPEYPGIGCTNFALYHREQEYGVTAHQMVERVDRGPIIAVRRFPILAEDSVFTLTQRSYENLRLLFEEVLSRFFETGKFPTCQERWAQEPTTRLDLERLCEIKPGMSPEEVERRVRATTYPGMPGAYTEVHGYRFEVVFHSKGGNRREQVSQGELSAS